MVHDDNARIARWRTLELFARVLELRFSQRADDRDITKAPRERVSRDTVCGVEPNERGAWNAKRRLEIFGDMRTVAFGDARVVPNAERRTPPHYVVIAGKIGRAHV